MLYILKCKLCSDDLKHWKIIETYYAKKRKLPKDDATFLEQNSFNGLHFTLSEQSKEKIRELLRDVKDSFRE